jgi:hypothetical protein
MIYINDKQWENHQLPPFLSPKTLPLFSQRFKFFFATFSSLPPITIARGLLHLD